MIRIYLRFWQVNWAEQWQYRANLLMYLLYWLVSPVVYLSVWSAVANAQGNVHGLTANDFVTYYMALHQRHHPPHPSVQDPGRHAVGRTDAAGPPNPHWHDDQ
jgi:hypothetical protein